MTPNRKCITCGKEYTYCNHCPGNYKADEQWRNIYCSQTCREIFNICSSKILSNEEAYTRLNNLTLPSRFTDGIQKEINRIQGYKKKEAVQEIIETAPKKKTRRKKIVNEKD